MQTPTKRNQQPWQLQMFDHSLKKPRKLKALLALLGDVSGQRCLLVTCGDNNGALNWYFRQHGGQWTWADVAGDNLEEMSRLLGESVHAPAAERLPFKDGWFESVVAIDVLEHLEDEQPFLRELRRVVRPSGQIIVTVPNGDPNLLANRIRWRLGMTPDIYGHKRPGYTLAELRNALQQADLMPVHEGGYSRFFTEMIELAINLGYVFVLSRKRAPTGQIAPASVGELNTHSGAYRLYKLLFPIFRAISQLDHVLPPSTNNAVIVSAVREGNR